MITLPQVGDINTCLIYNLWGKLRFTNKEKGRGARKSLFHLLAGLDSQTGPLANASSLGMTLSTLSMLKDRWLGGETQKDELNQLWRGCTSAPDNHRPRPIPHRPGSRNCAWRVSIVSTTDNTSNIIYFMTKASISSITKRCVLPS